MKTREKLIENTIEGSPKHLWRGEINSIRRVLSSRSCCHNRCYCVLEPSQIPLNLCNEIRIQLTVHRLVHFARIAFVTVNFCRHKFTDQIEMRLFFIYPHGKMRFSIILNRLLIRFKLFPLHFFPKPFTRAAARRFNHFSLFYRSFHFVLSAKTICAKDLRLSGWKWFHANQACVCQ